jgi:hypothetical protein
MKKITQLLLLLLSTNALSEWNQIGTNDISSGYIDFESIKKNGDKVQIWTLIDNKESVDFKGVRYLTEVAHYEFDCKEDRQRGLDFSLYSGHMETGNAVYSLTNIKIESEPVIPGTIGDEFFKIACGNFIKPNKKIEAQITLEVTARFVNMNKKSGMSGVSADIEKCYSVATSGKSRDMQACIIYDTAATYLDRSFLKAMGVKDISTTPFLDKSAFDARMAIYKEAAFKKYITYDVAIFIKEAKDIIIKAVIKSV